MEFKNNKTEGKRVRIEEGTGVTKGYRWLTVKPGDTINIAENYGLNLGLTPTGKVDETDTDENESVEDNKSDSEENKEDTSFSDELQAIDGIGKATVTDILKVYPNRKSLLKAVLDNVELPFRNDVSQKLYYMFPVATKPEDVEDSTVESNPEEESDPDDGEEKKEE